MGGIDIIFFKNIKIGKKKFFFFFLEKVQTTKKPKRLENLTGVVKLIQGINSYGALVNEPSSSVHNSKGKTLFLWGTLEKIFNEIHTPTKAFHINQIATLFHKERKDVKALVNVVSADLGKKYLFLFLFLFFLFLFLFFIFYFFL